MIQDITVLGSLLIAAAMVVLIVCTLADEWAAVCGALARRGSLTVPPLPDRRPRGDRRARVLAVRSQSAPRAAVA